MDNVAQPHLATGEDDGLTPAPSRAAPAPADAQRMAVTAGGAVAMVEALRRLRTQLRRGVPADDLPDHPDRSG